MTRGLGHGTYERYAQQGLMLCFVKPILTLVEAQFTHLEHSDVTARICCKLSPELGSRTMMLLASLVDEPRHLASSGLKSWNEDEDAEGEAIIEAIADRARKENERDSVTRDIPHTESSDVAHGQEVEDWNHVVKMRQTRRMMILTYKMIRMAIETSMWKMTTTITTTTTTMTIMNISFGRFFYYIRRKSVARN